MKDRNKTKSQLLSELEAMRQHMTELEKSENARKATEEALHESDLKFHALAERTTAAIFVIQKEKYVYINPAFTNMTGYSFEDLSSMNFWDIITPDMRDLVRRRGVGRQNGEDVPPRYDLKFITKSGEERSGAFDATFIKFQNKPAILGTVLDITERIKMELALRASEEKYRELVENANSIVLRMDTTGKITFFNEFAQRFFGYEEEEILGKNVVGTIVPPIESTGRDLHSMIEDIGVNPKRYVNNINENIRLNGERVWIAWTNRPVYGKTGKLSEIMCVGNDITESKKAEDLLRLAEEKYRNIFENSIMGIFQTTPEGHCLSANSEMAKIFGYESPQEMTDSVNDIGQQLYVDPELRARLIKLAQEGVDLYQFETEMYRKDGAKIWVSVNVRAMRGADGKIYCFEGTVEDITERKHIEILLRESEDRYSAVVKQARDGIVLIQDSTCQFANEAMADTLGYAPGELDGIPFTNCLAPDDRAMVAGWVKARIRGEDVPTMYETRLIRKDGRIVDAELSACVIHTDGHPVDLVMIRDISERKHSEKALQESERKFRDLVEKSLVGVYLIRHDGVVGYVNARCAEIFGYEVKEVIDILRVEDIVFPEDWPIVRENVRVRLLGELVSNHYEFRIVTKNKDVKYVEVYGSLTVCEGKPAIIGTLLDITERKEAEKACVESERKYRELVAQLPDTVWEFDENGVYTFINLHGLQIFGYTAEDLGKGLTIFQTMAPEDRDRARENLQKRNHGEEIGRNEYNMFRKDGTRFPALIHTNPIIRDGRPAGFRSVVVDITEQRLAEEALKESEERYRTIFENAVLGIFQTSPEGRFIRINSAFARMHGYGSPEEMIAATTDVAQQHYVNPLDRTRLERLLKAHGTVRFEAQYYRKDKSKIWLVMNVRAVSGPDGKILYYEGTVEDITERKRVEHELEESERKFRDLSEKSIAGIYLLQEDGLVKYVNARCAEIFGYAVDEVINILRVEDVIFPEDWPIVRESVSKRISGKLPSDHYEFRIVTKDNVVKHVETYSSITIYEGRPAVLGTLLDITERKRAAEFMQIQHDLALALNATSSLEEGLSLCLEGAMQVSGMDCGGIYLTDSKSGSLDLVCHHGLSSAFVKSKSHFDADAPNTRLVMAGQNVYTEFRDLGVPQDEGDRSERLRVIAILPIYCEGEVIGCLNIASHTKCEIPAWTKVALETIASKVCSTVTRLIGQKALWESERRFREFADLLPQIVFELDGMGSITFMNRYALDKHGYTLDDLSENSEIFQYLIPEDRGRARELAERILKGEKFDGTELTAIKKDGITFPILVYLSPVKDEVGITGIRGIAIDISDHKNLEEQLHHAQKLQSIGTLAGGIAHDFNNLLTTILGCSQLLRMKANFDGKTGEYVERITEAAESAAQLTQNLLTFSRKQVATPIVIDPNIIVEKIEKLALRTIGENIICKVMYGTSDLRIMADVNQMEQVLMNIFINARDAMPHGGTINVKIEEVQLDRDFIDSHGGGQPGRYAKIAVKDSGIGMDSKTMDRIFEPFFTTKEVGKGTGLGLSIVYGIIRKHNGYVTVSSEPGRGTKVEVYLPFTDAASETSTVASDLVHLEKGNETILIAEDDPLMLNMLKAILEEGGYRIIEAVDGEDALQKYVQHKERIEMVILDVMMPKKNAKDVFEVIKVLDPFQKILFISGYTPEDMDKSGIFKENFNLIKKPFLPDYLLKKVREVFAG